MAKMSRRAPARAAPPFLAFLAFFASMTIALSGRNALAQPNEPVPVLALDWNAPKRCPDGAKVRARVEQLVGRSHGDRTLTARGAMTVSGTPPRYRLVLRVTTTSTAFEERTMTGADCTRLAEAAALILALDIDHDAAAHESNDEVGVDASPAQEDTATEPPPAPQRARREAERRPPNASSSTGGKDRLEMDRLAMSVGPRLVFDHGSLPRSTLALGAAVELAYRAIAVDVGGMLYQRQFASGPREGSGGAYVDLATAFANGCWRRTDETLGLRMCAGVELGSERTRGVGIAEPGSSSGPWGAGIVSVDARLRQLGPIVPMAGIGVGHPFVAPDVVIGGFGTLFTPPLLFVRVHLGLEFRLF
jgi:hypothetical protein